MQTTPAPASIEALPPSQLGTRQYWSGVYAREREAYEACGDDALEHWFGSQSAHDMVEWVQEHFPLGHVTEPMCVLDVGCGNGHLLCLLHAAGYTCPSVQLTGIDYTHESIALAQEVTTTNNVRGVRLEQLDFMNETIQSSKPDGLWHLLVDKGTFDAISLSGPEFRQFPSRVAAHLAPSSLFLITSCNWTRHELQLLFCQPDEPLFTFHSQVKRPSFTFGGQTGNSITTVAFQRS